MPQCPLCKRNANVENGRCERCQGDLTALQVVRDLPAHLYNAGLEAARCDDSLQAILKVAAASQLGERPEPWLVLGKLFANEGAIGHARTCFSEAQKRGAAVPEVRIQSLESWKSDAVNAAKPLVGSAAKIPVERLPEHPVVPSAARTGISPSIAGWALLAILVGVGIGLGWRIQEYQVEKVMVAPPREGQIVSHRTTATEKGDIPAFAVSSGAIPERPPQVNPEGNAVLAQPQQDVIGHADRGASAGASPLSEELPVGRRELSTEPTLEIEESTSPPRSTDVSVNPAPAAVRSDETARYVVQRGDSLWRIARNHLGTGQQWHTLYQANRDNIADSGRLRVGQVLVIPNLPE